MGNHDSRLKRNFSSLPAENFPSNNQHLLTTVRSVRDSSHAPSGSFKHGDGYDLSISQLFLPEYPQSSDTSVDDFQVLSTIARGAFGDVLQTRHKKHGVVYAMKILQKQKVVLEDCVMQCKDEAVIQASVGHHPFIVQPYWFFQNFSNLYIVMEYIACGELFELWRKQHRFSEPLVVIYAAELAMVLDYLHCSGIIYRDLKMENILIDIQGHLQVTDFGLAKWLKKGHKTYTICGTLQYIAPEVVNMWPYDHASDWWSLGILIYTLLEGWFPVSSAKNHSEMAEMMGGISYELPRDEPYSLEMRQCLYKLLQRDPTIRIRSLDTLQRCTLFKNLNFDSLYYKQFSPQYLSQQLGHSCGLPSQNHQKRISSEFYWNDSIASLNGTFI